MQASLVTAVTAGMTAAIKKSVTGVGTTLQMVVVETIPKEIKNIKYKRNGDVNHCCRCDCHK